MAAPSRKVASVLMSLCAELARCMAQVLGDGHVVISGTGRAGTTFLIELLTALGQDTGFTIHQLDNERSSLPSGLELDIRGDAPPRFVKNPWFCDYAEEVITQRGIPIEHVVIPIRDLHDAAESRRNMTKKGRVDGGLWKTSSLEPGDQEQILLGQLYKLLHSLAPHSIPITLISFPKLVRDSGYLYSKLSHVLRDCTIQKFEEAFNRVADLALVSDFGVS